jgi:acyl dehydratase
MAATIPKKMAIRVSMLGFHVLVFAGGQINVWTWVSFARDEKRVWFIGILDIDGKPG